MGALFRSEEMSLAQLFIQPEAAYFVISELGETGSVQFRDLNENVNAFQKKFVNEVRRCDEMERKLRYVEGEILKENQNSGNFGNFSKISIPDFPAGEIPRAPNPREIIDLEAHLEKTEQEIKEFTLNAVDLKQNFLELSELRHVLEKTGGFFENEGENLEEAGGNFGGGGGGGRLGFIAGVIQRERIHGFERMLWRISRGNVFLRRGDIGVPLEDPQTGNEIHKTVFVAFFQGEQLKMRLKKICAGFHASTYPCPAQRRERLEMLEGVKTRLKDLEMVLNQTQDHRQRLLSTIAKELTNWKIMVKKMKTIYFTLNMFNVDVTKKCLIAECWLPMKNMEIVQRALNDGSKISGSSIPSFMNVIATNQMPPTFNYLNKFTKGFQNLIDAYGVANYREVNPALYTIITFPFLFAIMFGDVGHSLIMLSVALIMLINEKKIESIKGKGEIINIFFEGRYIIFLMSLFSFYTGSIYNDFFSKSVNFPFFGGSKWKNLYDKNFLETFQNVSEVEMDPREAYLGTPYIFGVDPIWQLAKNKIIFLNSFKMKLSIIFGVIHMIFGVCMSVPNFIYFKRKSDVFLQFLPQIVFLLCIFFWMVVMIFWKWLQYSAENGSDDTLGTSCAPSVLIYFINMMLLKNQEEKENCALYLFEFQPYLQKILFFTAMLMIPIMLFGKIILKKIEGKPQKKSINLKKLSQTNGIEMTQKLEENGEEIEFKPRKNDNFDEEIEEEEEEDLSELMIHQAIHTIEYVLSTVSHTASYLRLWALSLAHAQLSEVLWSMLFNKAFVFENYLGAIAIYLIFAIWAFFSVAILVLMEGLSAFLHTLRLHWVEFMSKFYTGEGYAFQPFDFKAILDEDD